MPSAFTDQAETQIREKLRSTGRALFAAQGVQKTSVEQLTNAASIAKGSFYKFYDSKEQLFFELLEDVQQKIRAPLIADKISNKSKTRAKFESLTHVLFQNISNEPLIQFMARESEMMAIVRRVPIEIMQAHKHNDQRFLDSLIDKWNTKRTPPNREIVGSRISIILLVSFNRDFLGEQLLPHAAVAAISSLADCFFAKK